MSLQYRIYKNNKMTYCITNDNNHMLFTGIIDKNGKEIYDGDICKVHKFTQELSDFLGVSEGEFTGIGLIEFNPYGGMWIKFKDDDNGCPVWEFEEGWYEESLEVIGNKYENPELLEGWSE